MLRVTYLAILMVLSTPTLGIAPTIEEIFVYDDLIKYHPQHWEEDGFPPVLILRR
jgi:hypothetical protein